MVYLRRVLMFALWIVSMISLPMLSLAASYGVYRYSLHFLPDTWARILAGSFESVYIGLIASHLKEDQLIRAKRVAMGAVAVSVLYNTLDALFILRPKLLIDKEWYVDVLLALTHGVPIAVLAYNVADLRLHGALPSLDSIDDAHPAAAPAAKSGGQRKDGWWTRLGKWVESMLALFRRSAPAAAPASNWTRVVVLAHQGQIAITDAARAATLISRNGAIKLRELLVEDLGSAVIEALHRLSIDLSGEVVRPGTTWVPLGDQEAADLLSAIGTKDMDKAAAQDLLDSLA